jgi:hypothetical protein
VSLFRPSLLVAACAALLACDQVRPLRSPADDVRLTVSRAGPPRPDDCRVAIVDGHCHVEIDRTGEAPFRIECDAPPPPDRLVGHASVCTRDHGELADLNRRVCRAGGDTIMLEVEITDSCIEESFDTVMGTAVDEYSVYRLRP